MNWIDAKKNPPTESGFFLGLELYRDFEEGDEWVPHLCLFYKKTCHDETDVWADLQGHEAEVRYYMPLPEYPPIPMRQDKPICPYYTCPIEDMKQCYAQKGMPTCYCGGDINKCER